MHPVQRLLRHDARPVAGLGSRDVLLQATGASLAEVGALHCLAAALELAVDGGLPALVIPALHTAAQTSVGVDLLLLQTVVLC